MTYLHLLFTVCLAMFLIGEIIWYSDMTPPYRDKWTSPFFYYSHSKNERILSAVQFYLIVAGTLIGVPIAIWSVYSK